MLRISIPSILSLLLLATAAPVEAQSPSAAEPIVGLRDRRPESYALVGADVVTQPGSLMGQATVLIEGTSIVAVGKNLDLPAGCQIIDCTGKRIYAGLIDAYSQVSVPLSGDQPAYWNSHIAPQRNAASVASNSLEVAGKLRSQGIAVRVLAPEDGIVKGSSCVVLLGSQRGQRLLQSTAWHHLQLTVPRTGPRPSYPNSPMGATALLRQSLYDAQWYSRAWSAYRAQPTLPRPETNHALEVLAQAIDEATFVIDAQNERMAIRAGKLADEFSLKWILRGSGREYRQLDEIAAMKRPVLVPVDFPETPKVQSAEGAMDTSLQELLHWDLAPENPSRLHQAGLTICLTTDGLEDPGKFLSQVRVAVKRGLDGDAALAAVTTGPANLLGLDAQIGRVQPGMLANLIVCDGELWDAKTKVKECWVAGEQFVVSPDTPAADPLAGEWSTSLRVAKVDVALTLNLKQDGDKLSGEIQLTEAKTRKEQDQEKGNEEAKEDEQKSDKTQGVASVKLQNLVRGRDRVVATAELNKLAPELAPGFAQLTIITVGDQPSGVELFASVVLPNGETTPLRMKRVEQEAKAPEASEASETKPNEPSEPATESEALADNKTDPKPASSPATPLPATPTLVPLGAYGLTEPIRDQPTVLFRGATVWTCEEQGTLQQADVLIREGLIVAVGIDLEVPEGCQVIDVQGKHITPGLIDCHSHMATDGGVNESGQAVTAEVRIGDFIDNSDIHIFRQLAGGLTTSNILHGSANPIGGQNQVIKLRWGETMDGLRMREAPGGIKFALGENVKRSQSRYPNTRMGVEQLIRDQLLAAREYQTHWRDWNQGIRDRLPPRVDLQLQALAEVQRGERWIHCHSYRQDEIVATLEVLEEFGIQIGTLQHILEGYKVADRMAQHGAMGSSFSDWWAYKFEVYDAIPYNGALMHDRGVVVSFNSDDRELARRMNTEAAKATKYGGVPEQEALKFVTLNPAKQLRIEQYVGSLAPGKHADLVVWSGRPLSTLSRCEQTWIDGRKYFDLDMERQLRTRDAELRSRLIQKALNGGVPVGNAKQEEVAEEDRWDRFDAFCTANGTEKNRQALSRTNEGGAK